MSDFAIESGSAEAVAFRLMQLILSHQPGEQGKEGLLRLYAECIATVRGPVAEDLLAALSMED